MIFVTQKFNCEIKIEWSEVCESMMHLEGWGSDVSSSFIVVLNKDVSVANSKKFPIPRADWM